MQEIMGQWLPLKLIVMVHKEKIAWTTRSGDLAVLLSRMMGRKSD